MDHEERLRDLADNELAFLGKYLGGPRSYPSREAAIAAILDACESVPDDDPRSGVLFRYFGMTPMGDLVARGRF